MSTARRLVLFAVWSGLGATGCERAPAPVRPRPAAAARVHAFTETSPVRLLASVGPFLFAASERGLDRWDVATGAVLSLSAAHGLPGDQIRELAGDEARGLLWIVTDAGVARYDARAQALEVLPAPPKGLGLDLGDEITAAEAADDSGLWIGGARGLFHVDADGEWTATAVTVPVTALHAADGWLWIGTSDGVVGRDPDGELVRFGAAEGCEVARPRFLVRGPGGGVLVAGDDATGRQRVALRRGDDWTSYRVSPDVRWASASPQGDELIVLADGGLYRVAARQPRAHRPLMREGGRLLPIAGATAPAESFVVDRIDARLTTPAQAIAVHGGEIAVGTRDVGVARVPASGGAPVGWLRRAEMLTGASTLTVACRGRDDCVLATGARRAWRWRGDRFEGTGPEDQVVLAVVKGPGGALYGVHRAADGRQITVSRIDDDAWTAVAELETPGEQPRVSFARFGPAGRLWVGLVYRDGADERPWGVATVDVAAGAVAYHHEGEPRGPLMPMRVADAAFQGGAVWMATSEGAVRLDGDRMTIWDEASGMGSALSRAVAVAPDGTVYVATRAGVAQFDGTRWSMPRALAFPVNDLALDRDHRLWLATERGVVVYDGRKVRRVDRRRGLLENAITDVALDDYGRVWARGAQSLTIIAP